MCTVIVAHRYFKDIPLIVAANRDEFFNRQTDPPSIINNNPAIFAPRDRLKLGTFLGINEWGLFAIITNISGLIPKDHNKKSRGHLVLRALGSPDTSRLFQDFKHIDFSEYNYFQLFVSDKNNAYLIRYKGSLDIFEIKEGIHTFSNWDAIPEVADYKNSIIMSKLDELTPEANIEEVINKFKNILTLHEGVDMRFQICVHTENYGTLSSSIIAPFQKNPIFYYSIGPVCKNGLRSYSEALKSILKF